MAFLTDAQVLSSVADTLKYQVSALPAYWSNIVTQQHAAAYQYLIGKLLSRGFTLAQIQQWDQGPYYEMELSKFFIFTDAAAVDAVSLNNAKLRDVRKELETVLVSIGGAYVTPAASGDAPGTVSFGSVVDTYSTMQPYPDNDYLRQQQW